MIHPRMATMLAVVLTDAAAEPADAPRAPAPAAARTWNQLTVDGDTSTNDTVFLLASGRGRARAGRGRDPTPRARARRARSRRSPATSPASRRPTARARPTLITCQVTGAVDDAEARAVARAVDLVGSLVKAAVHGRDPNWGRIAGAAGNAPARRRAPCSRPPGSTPRRGRRAAGPPATLDPDRLRIAIAGHLVFDGRAGGPVDVRPGRGARGDGRARGR